MYDKIMVPLDGSDLAECVLPHVEAIVAGFNVRPDKAASDRAEERESGRRE